MAREHAGVKPNRRARAGRAGLVAVLVAALTPFVGAVVSAEGGPVSQRSDLGIVSVLTGVGTWANPAVTFRVAPSGQIFVGRKSGLVQRYDGPGDATPTTIINLENAVYDQWDHGLIGMALDPAFTTEGYLYVLYSYNRLPGGGAVPRWGGGGAGDQCPSPPGVDVDGCLTTARVSRFYINAAGSAGGENVVLQNGSDGGWCEQFPSHSVGSLAFGPDGALFVSSGEGAHFYEADWGQKGGTLPTSSNPVVPKNPCGDPPGGVGGSMTAPSSEGGALRAQSVRSTVVDNYQPWGGSILRINPATGAAMPNNPLVGNGIAADDRIVATGLRNPWRFTLKPGTNEIWTGDVGWNTYEEIDRFAFDPSQKVVGNFGWPCYEGPQMGWGFTGFDLCTRLYADAQGNGESAVGSGGSRTKLLAAKLSWRHDEALDSQCTSTSSAAAAGAFLSSGVWPGDLQGAFVFGDYSRRCIWAMKAPSNGGEPDAGNIETLVTNTSVLDMQTGPSGDLYFVDLDGGLYRVAPVSSNLPPTASFTATPPSGSLPLTVSFDASSSSDPNGDALTYSWDLDGNGSFGDATGATASRTYNSYAQVNVGLRVSDPSGATADMRKVVYAGNAAPVIGSITTSASTGWVVGQGVLFSASVTDDVFAPLTYEWEVILHHCSRYVTTDCHTHSGAVNGLPNAASGGFTVPDHDYPTRIELRLTARDAQGASDTESVMLEPRVANLAVTSSPSGIQMNVAGENLTTPFTLPMLAGTRVQVLAPQTTNVGGFLATLREWTGSALNGDGTVTVGVGGVSLNAVYDVISANPPDVGPVNNIGSGFGTPDQIHVWDDGRILQFAANGSAYLWEERAGIDDPVYVGRIGTGFGRPSQVQSVTGAIFQFTEDGRGYKWTVDSSNSVSYEGRIGTGFGTPDQVRVARLDSGTYRLYQFASGGRGYLWDDSTGGFVYRGLIGTGFGFPWQTMARGGYVYQFTQDGRAYRWSTSGAPVMTYEGKVASNTGHPYEMRLNDDYVLHASRNGKGYLWTLDGMDYAGLAVSGIGSPAEAKFANGRIYQFTGGRGFLWTYDRP